MYGKNRLGKRGRRRTGKVGTARRSRWLAGCSPRRPFRSSGLAGMLSFRMCLVKCLAEFLKSDLWKILWKWSLNWNYFKLVLICCPVTTRLGRSPWFRICQCSGRTTSFLDIWLTKGRGIWVDRGRHRGRSRRLPAREKKTRRRNYFHFCISDQLTSILHN